MEYTANLIRALLEFKINKINPLKILEYNELLKKLLKKNTAWRD